MINRNYHQTRPPGPTRPLTAMDPVPVGNSRQDRVTASRHEGSRFRDICCWGCRSTLANGGICEQPRCPVTDRPIDIWYIREPIRAYQSCDSYDVDEIIRIYRDDIFRPLCKYWPCVRHEAVKSNCEREVTRVVTQWWDINFNTEMLHPKGHPLWDMMHEPLPWGKSPFSKRNYVGRDIVLLSEDQKEHIEAAVGRGYMEQF